MQIFFQNSFSLYFYIFFYNYLFSPSVDLKVDPDIIFLSTIAKSKPVTKKKRSASTFLPCQIHSERAKDTQTHTRHLSSTDNSPSPLFSLFPSPLRWCWKLLESNPSKQNSNSTHLRHDCCVSCWWCWCFDFSSPFSSFAVVDFKFSFFFFWLYLTANFPSSHFFCSLFPQIRHFSHFSYFFRPLPFHDYYYFLLVRLSLSLRILAVNSATSASGMVSFQAGGGGVPLKVSSAVTFPKWASSGTWKQQEEEEEWDEWKREETLYSWTRSLVVANLRCGGRRRGLVLDVVKWSLWLSLWRAPFSVTVGQVSTQPNAHLWN